MIEQSIANTLAERTDRLYWQLVAVEILGASFDEAVNGKPSGYDPNEVGHAIEAIAQAAQCETAAIMGEMEEESV